MNATDKIPYFLHPANSMSDLRMCAMVGEYGAAGYGMYWIAVELMHSDRNNFIKANLVTAMCGVLSTPSDYVINFLSDCAGIYKLFNDNGGTVSPVNYKLNPNLRLDTSIWKLISASVFQRDNFTCSYCGKVGGLLECDHVVAFSKGGSNCLENLTTSCRKCNRQKRDKSAKEFMDWKLNNNK